MSSLSVKIYKYYCFVIFNIAKIVYRLKNRECMSHQYDKYSVMPNILTSDECKTLIEISENNDAINEDNLLLAESKLQKLILSFKNNSLVYWAFPKDVLETYKHIPSPYYKIDLIKTIVNRMFNTFEKLMHSHICIEAVELYSTRPVSEVKTYENAEFHKDGDFNHSLKCLIYLNDVKELSDGPLIVKDSKGAINELYAPAGSGVIFQASNLDHKGFPPVNQRYCLNIKIYPSVFYSSTRIKKNINILSRLIWI